MKKGFALDKSFRKTFGEKEDKFQSIKIFKELQISTKLASEV